MVYWCNYVIYSGAMENVCFLVIISQIDHILADNLEKCEKCKSWIINHMKFLFS